MSMSTLMHLMSVWSYQSVWSSYVLYYSDAFIMPLASVNISSRFQRLFRCYLSSRLCSFVVLSLTEGERRVTQDRVWSVLTCKEPLLQSSGAERREVRQAAGFYSPLFHRPVPCTSFWKQVGTATSSCSASQLWCWEEIATDFAT